MADLYSLPPNELKLWQNLYEQSLTIDGAESTVQNDGSKQLVLLPMLTYTLISTMLQKLKYLPAQCFNRIVIGDTPICGLRPLTRASPPLMHRLTEILRPVIDGVRKQHIHSITMIFYKKDDIQTIYDAYSLVFDYSITLPDGESNTSIPTVAHLIHQIEYMFSWNDALPNDVELTFVFSALDQFEKRANPIPSPLHTLKPDVTRAHAENEARHLLGRLTTPDGKLWLKFLPQARQLSGSSIHSEDLPTHSNLFAEKRKAPEPVEQADELPIGSSPKLRKATKRSTKASDPGKDKPQSPSLSSTSTITKAKKKTGLLAAVKSLITPSRARAPVVSSTPNVDKLVLIPNTSTPKPGETASRITVGGTGSVPSLSAIEEISTPDARRTTNNTSSPAFSTITVTDISTAATPMLAVERRSTVRGQAAAARKKIAAMQIRDDDDEEEEDNDDDEEDDDEQFKKLFNRLRSKKPKTKAVVAPMKKADPSSDVSSISSAASNVESLFTPPTARKRPTTDRTGDDDLAAEHGTPPKTPRTGRRNRIEDLTSNQSMSMDTSDLPVNIDSPRLLRSVTKKLQQQASATKQLAYEDETNTSSQSTTQEEDEMNRVFIQLERSSIALHYSMDESE